MSFAWRRHAIRMVQGVIFALVAAWISACISSVQDKGADSVGDVAKAVVSVSASGEQLYLDHCSKCHEGGLPKAPHRDWLAKMAPSQCLEAWFAHIPGLKVVCPSDAASAYGLLRASIDEPNPVVFVENKRLYAVKGEVAEHPVEMPIGKAAIARAGSDATVVAYGATVGLALTAAQALSADGVEVEVVDLRSIQPWDKEAVLESVTRTRRLVIAHEAVEAFGVGAEIAATVADIGFYELDSPVVRVGAAFMPVPFARSLESEYLPDAKQIESAVRRTLE